MFQFLMPILGWAAGAGLERVIAAVDHRVAAALLVFIGLRWLRGEGSSSGETPRTDPSRGLMLVTVSAASTLDALAAGLSLAMLQFPIWLPSIVIGLTTGGVSRAGILLGTRRSKGLSRRAAQAGGAVMVLLALRILVVHLRP